MSHIKATTLSLYSVLFFLVSSVCSLLLLKRNLFCCSYKFAMYSYIALMNHNIAVQFLVQKIKPHEYCHMQPLFNPRPFRRQLLLLVCLNQFKSSHILCLTSHFLIDIITSFSNCNNLYIIIIYEYRVCVADETYIV